MTMRARFALLPSVVATLLALGCGGGSSSSTPTAPSVPVSFVPSTTVTSLSIVVFTGAVGLTGPLSAIAQFSDLHSENVSSRATWSSSNTQIATVSSTGVATCLRAGTTQITATFQGRTATVAWTVRDL